MSIRLLVWLLVCLVLYTRRVRGVGYLLLHKPKDVSNECAFSQTLRYDITFGMGIADTITLVLRTLSEVDYKCDIEIVTEKSQRSFPVALIMVIKFPNYLGVICQNNPSAFMLLRMERCYLLCSLVDEKEYYSYYYVTTVRNRFRFSFINNSSVNSDIDANVYEVTATSARVLLGNQTCVKNNETACDVSGKKYCITNGVVCDGIRNCGASDWYDERLSACQIPQQLLGITPVIAIGALSVCALLAAMHLLLRCLPPAAHSFFIFNANEDNRFCIDPTLRPPVHANADEDPFRRKSLVPIFSSSSSEADDKIEMDTSEQDSENREISFDNKKRKSTMKNVSEIIQERLRSMTDRIGWKGRPPPPPPV